MHQRNNESAIPWLISVSMRTFWKKKSHSMFKMDLSKQSLGWRYGAWIPFSLVGFILPLMTSSKAEMHSNQCWNLLYNLQVQDVHPDLTVHSVVTYFWVIIPFTVRIQVWHGLNHKTWFDSSKPNWMSKTSLYVYLFSDPWRGSLVIISSRISKA